MTGEEIDAFVSHLPPEEKPADGQQLAQALFRRKRLTKFQTQAVYQGKTRGLVLGNYEVLDRLGKGGMGEVFRARHRRMERVVALKILPAAAVQQESAVKRFHQEVKAAARLSHGNIVTAYDADEDRGLHFLVMEYVEGGDLASIVNEKGAMPVGRAVDCVLQAARGLQYAHTAGVIHRDIKPNNLLLDANGTVKVLDMGLARIADIAQADAATVDAGLTSSGEVLGTVDYMSPEQAVNTKDADARSDIYSLGATLYFLLTARPMFSGSSLVERLLAHRETPVPSLCAARADVPESLDQLFQRMVAKKREDRPASMAEVVVALESLALSIGTQAAEPPMPRAADVETMRLAGVTSGTAGATRATSPHDATIASAAGPAAAPSTPRAAAVPSSHASNPPADAVKHPAQKEPFKASVSRGFVPPRASRKPTVKAPLESLWAKAVEDASKVRRSPWPLIKRLLGWAATSAVLCSVLAGGYVAVANYQKNVQRVHQSEKLILDSLNPWLRTMQIQPLTTLHFTNASPYFRLPDTIGFEAELTPPTQANRRTVGALRGTFDRSAGTMTLDVKMADGSEKRGITTQLIPVP